jgi:hypothetical protein
MSATTMPRGLTLTDLPPLVRESLAAYVVAKNAFHAAARALPDDPKSVEVEKVRTARVAFDAASARLEQAGRDVTEYLIFAIGGTWNGDIMALPECAS